MDLSLSFLDEYVANALERGHDPYRPPSMRQPEITGMLAIYYISIKLLTDSRIKIIGDTPAAHSARSLSHFHVHSPL